jgi:hypothetical protein
MQNPSQTTLVALVELYNFGFGVYFWLLHQLNTLKD